MIRELVTMAYVAFTSMALARSHCAASDLVPATLMMAGWPAGVAQWRGDQLAVPDLDEALREAHHHGRPCGGLPAAAGAA
jgi:hypothetical protein